MDAPVTESKRRLLPVRSNGAAALGDAARDALDHGRSIVRDSYALAKLEAKHAATELGPRLAWGSVAVAFGVVGAVFAFIALFEGLGYLIESIAIRTAIFAVLFLAVACFGGLMASRRSAASRSLGD